MCVLCAVRAANNGTARRIEYLRDADGMGARDKIVFYLGSIGATPTCVTFRATRGSKKFRKERPLRALTQLERAWSVALRRVPQ